jgi:chemotaxis protein methyltransferase CheR
VDPAEIAQLEAEMLLSLIKDRYHYDFTQYSKASIFRRIDQLRVSENLDHISELIPRILYDKSFFSSFVHSMSVTVTEMFRDPFIYKLIRDKVIPFLASFPKIKIWHAGCATGEEVYSMAIMLQEAGLYDRSLLYATDMNNHSLDIARKGIYPVDCMKKYTENYQQSEGQAVFSDYYRAKYSSVIMNDSLKENLVFSNHNLVHDQVFGEMQFILCRNVLIYFDHDLQARVFSLFDDSLCRQGILCLGTKESMHFSSIQSQYRVLGDREKIFQKKPTYSKLKLLYQSLKLMK